MPTFITYASYSHSGAKGPVDNPSDRTAVIKAHTSPNHHFRLATRGRSIQLGHELPRHFTGSAAEIPPKAVTPVVHWRGRDGP
jgi:hypothetical protein